MLQNAFETQMQKPWSQNYLKHHQGKRSRAWKCTFLHPQARPGTVGFRHLTARKERRRQDLSGIGLSLFVDALRSLVLSLSMCLCLGSNSASTRGERARLHLTAKMRAVRFLTNCTIRAQLKPQRTMWLWRDVTRSTPRQKKLVRHFHLPFNDGRFMFIWNTTEHWVQTECLLLDRAPGCHVVCVCKNISTSRIRVMTD